MYLRGCEAEYLEPLFGTTDFCENPPASDGGGGRRLREGGPEEHDLDDRAVKFELPPASVTSPRTRPPATKSKKERTNRTTAKGRRKLEGEAGLGEPTLSLATGTPGTGGAGSLVIHIRSGDIFAPLLEKKAAMAFPGYGQVRVCVCKLESSHAG